MLKKLTRVIVEDRELFSDFVETIRELFVIAIRENVVDAAVFVQVLLNS